MSKASALTNGGSRLAPWLQIQLESLLAQRGHAWLLSGPSGLGQFDLALALAKAWLCEQPTAQGACGHCGSCHAIEVHTHADLCMLIPETLSLALAWPLDEKTQDDLDGKKRKPSKEIKVDAAREAVSFTQFTRSRGTTKVVLVYPAERMNHITANTLLKTLEEPPGAVKFILATEAAHQLLPTIRSRCIGHTMVWPEFEPALAWLAAETAGNARNPAMAPEVKDLHTLLLAAGGRPADALLWVENSQSSHAAQHWRGLPTAVARGDVSAFTDWAPARVVDALQKICHDMCSIRVGASPRFFSVTDLPVPSSVKPGVLPVDPCQSSLQALTSWSKELIAIARTEEHPYNSGLLIESLVSRAHSAVSVR